jgi:hypothetical protein
VGQEPWQSASLTILGFPGEATRRVEDADSQPEEEAQRGVYQALRGGIWR